MLPAKCFDAIGFKAPDVAEFNHYLDIANLKGHHLAAERCRYAILRVENGIEVWQAFDNNLSLKNSNPHFLGSSRVAVQILQPFDVVASVEGILKVRTNPHDATAPHLTFAVNMPSWDFARPFLKELKDKAGGGPLIVNLQVTAFADALECFESPEAYDEAHRPPPPEPVETHHGHIGHHGHLGRHKEPETPPEPPPPPPMIDFHPSTVLIEGTKRPQPQAGLSGIVESGHVIENPYTKQRTCHIGVRTTGMILDLVADVAVVQGRPKRGGIVRGPVWLSARLEDEIEATQKRLPK